MSCEEVVSGVCILWLYQSSPSLHKTDRSGTRTTCTYNWYKCSFETKRGTIANGRKKQIKSVAHGWNGIVSEIKSCNSWMEWIPLC